MRRNPLFSPLRRVTRGSAVGVAVLGVLASASCTKQLPPPGELVVAVSTDVAIPKDIDTIRMQVLSSGSPLYDEAFAVFPGLDGVKIPVTLGLVAGTDPNATVLVRVIAIGKRKALILREATVQVPTNRTAVLPLPLQWLSEGSAADPSPLTPGFPDPMVDPIEEKNCKQGDTEIAGQCESEAVDAQKLHDYAPELVFGGGTPDGGGRCFDTIACFPSQTAAKLDLADCTVPTPSGASTSKLNVALVPADGAGICGSNGCFVPLDKDPSAGWAEATTHGRIQLPKGLCDRVRAGLKTTIAVSTDCAAKTAGMPTCGPWSAETVSDEDGGAAEDASVETGPSVDGGAPEDAAEPDANPVEDGSTGTCGSERTADGGECNTLENIAAPITQTCVEESPPAMTGGSIVDGTYALTAAKQYGGCGDAGSVAAQESETLKVSGTCVELAETGIATSSTPEADGSVGVFDAGSMTATATYSIATHGNMSDITTVCLPGGGTGGSNPTEFTATPTTLTLLTQNTDLAGAADVLVFTKR